MFVYWADELTPKTKRADPKKGNTAEKTKGLKLAMNSLDKWMLFFQLENIAY